MTEEGPRAIINPFKDKTRQNGRRIKEPNEPMFTLTVTDRHGIVHRGRIRRLIVKRHVKHKKRENPKKAVKKQNTPYKLRIYGVYEV